MTKKTTKPVVNLQRKALQKLCNIYWEEFKDAELKHDRISDAMKVYSDGPEYIHFYPVSEESVGFGHLGLFHDKMTFEAAELTEASFSRAIKFIRKELSKKIIDPQTKAKNRVKDLRAELKRKREELKAAQSILTK